MNNDEDEQIECPKCGSDRVAIEALPLNDDPIFLVCRSCGHFFEYASIQS